MSQSPVVVLHHGTTLQRAERILRSGPDPRFVEPGGQFYDPAGGFSTYEAGVTVHGRPTAETYALGKATNFPAERGATILEVEVPRRIVDIVERGPDGWGPVGDAGEFRFIPGCGLEELLHEWPLLVKCIRTV